MNKKAILIVNNTITVVIAIAGLILLFLGSWRLYTNITYDEESEIAQTTIDLVKAKIDALEDGENTTQIVQGFESDQRWYLLGWGTKERNRPDKCLQSCVCICKTEDSRFLEENIANSQIIQISEEEFANACQEKGFCREVDKTEVLVGSSRRITTTITGSLPSDNRIERGFLFQDNIPLSGEPLQKIDIQKRKDTLSVSFVGSPLKREDFAMEGGGP